MASRIRDVLSRVVLGLSVALGAAAVVPAPSRAQPPDIASPFDSSEPTEADMPRLDEQNVQPARQQLLFAVQKLRQDRQAGDQSSALADEIAVIEARRAMIDAQLLADQTRLPQSPPAVQAMLQARDRVLHAEAAVGDAQKRLISDQRSNNTAALHDDVAVVNAARLDSLRARREWVEVHDQLRELQPPADPK
jgi:hypothetical protein